jgi:NADH:ubiquinone oxidoreductase subunit 5 (subunit L)/multisubunit Na+/H+ antiporter MnhA subunit
MVFLLGVGLAFYAMFSLLDATLHHDEKSSDAKRWAALAHGLWRTAVYAVFSVYALYTAFNGQSDSGSSRHENAKQSHWSARVLSWPAGWLWLGALGVALLAGAAYLVSTAVRRSFRKRLKQDEMTPRAWRIATVSGVAGHLGRAALYALAGWFITSAAVENDPSNGHGLDGSARDFANNAGGAALLYVVAAALVAFGVYMWCEARYRRV